MKSFIIRIGIFLASAGLSLGLGSKDELIGYIRADLYTPSPLSLNGTTRITTHHYNISNTPIKIKIREMDFNPILVYVHTVEKGADPYTKDVFGPSSGEPVFPFFERIKIEGIEIPGYDDMMAWINRTPEWPERDGIILLRDEGYARKVVFLPGWARKEGAPPDLLSLRHLVMGASPLFLCQEPLLGPDAFQPGKHVIFDKPKKVFVMSSRLIPFQAVVPPQPPEKDTTPTGLSLEIEIWKPVEAGKDITAVYLIGNNGPGAVWVWQNKLVPAYASWALKGPDNKTHLIDNETMKILADLLPARDPALLNPGEYLTYRRTLPASSLPIKRMHKYNLNLTLDAHYSTTAPEPDTEPQIITLKTGTLIQPK